jgi:hypothetical protein
MNNEEWLLLSRQAYDSSTSYIDSNLRAQWEDNISMYKSKHPAGSKYHSDLYKKKSRIFRPKTRTSGIHFDSDLSRAFFSTAEHVRLLPENMQDEYAVAGASVGTDLLSHHLDKNIPWFKLVVGAGQEAWKMGDVFSHQGWAYEVNSAGKVTKDQPEVTLIPSENIRIDESADWTDPINSSPYAIWVDYMYVCDILARVKLGDEGKQVGWLPVTEGEILAARDFKWNSTQSKRDPNNVDTVQNVRALSSYDMVPVHKNFMREDGEKWVYYTLANQTMLSDPILLEEEYPQGMPFVMGNLMVSPFTAYHEGQPEIGQPLQEEINYVANDRIDNVHLVLNKRYFAKRGRNVDFRSLLRNVAGSITMMDDPMEDVVVQQTPDITQSAYVEQDRLDGDFDELLGTFSPLLQQKAGQASGGSVGGMGMAQAGSAGVTEYNLTCFRETWVEPVMRQLATLVLYFQSEDTINQVVRDTEAVELLQNLEMPVEEFLMGLRVNVNVGISATSPQLRVEKMLYAFGALGKVAESPIATRLDIDEVTTEIFGQLGYRDGKRFFNDKEADPVIADLKQQVEQLTQQLQSKMAEIQAKNEVKSKELEFNVFKYNEEKGQRDAELQKTTVEAQKVMADIEEIFDTMANAGVDDLAMATLQLGYDKLRQQQVEFETNNATKRDEIMVGWKKAREDLEAKLKIVTENNRKNDGDQGRDVSNNTATVSKNAIETVNE